MGILSNWRIDVAILLVALLAIQTYRLAHEQANHADTRTAWANDRASWEKQSRQDSERARATEQHWIKQLAEIDANGQKDLAQAKADAVAAVDAGSKLRARIAALTANLKAGADTATADQRKAANTAADMLARVQLRLDQAADGIAGFADQSHLAGIACERSYEAVTSASIQ